MTMRKSHLASEPKRWAVVLLESAITTEVTENDNS